MAYVLTALKGEFGPLDTYLCHIPAGEIVGIVGHDPRGMYDPKKFHLPEPTKELYQLVQRAVDRKKVDELENYVEEFSKDVPDHGVGALPALSVGFRKAPTFTQAEGFRARSATVGEIELPSNVLTGALYLDGLKRACAVLNKYDEAKLGLITIAVMVFAPKPGKELSHQDLAQLFYDFNSKSTPIPRNIAVSRDGRDPHIQLANFLSGCAPIVNNGGVDRKGKSLGNKSSHICVLKDLVAFARAAADDEWAVEHLKDKPSHSPLESAPRREVLQQNLVVYLDALISGMTPTKFKDHISHIHLMAPVWTTFAILFHDLHVKLGMTDSELAGYASKIGQLDWSRHAPRLDPFMQNKTNAKGKTLRIPLQGGSQLRRALKKLVREELGITQQVEAWDRRHSAAESTGVAVAAE